MITQEKVKLIMKLYNERYKQKEIAEKVGISAPTVSTIIKTALIINKDSGKTVIETDSKLLEEVQEMKEMIKDLKREVIKTQTRISFLEQPTIKEEKVKVSPQITMHENPDKDIYPDHMINNTSTYMGEEHDLINRLASFEDSE